MEELETTEDNAGSEPDSLRDTIEKSISTLEAESTAQEESTTKQNSEESAQERARDEHGRFIKAEAAEKNIGQATEREEAITPPHFWDAAKKEQFKTLPKDIQQFLVEQDLNEQRYKTQLQQQLAQERKAREEEQEQIALFRQAQQELATNPRLALLQLAQQLNVNPSELIEYAQQYQSNPMLDSVNQKMQQMEQYLAAQQQAFEGQQVASIESEVQNYASEMDENGNLLRPHFEALYLEMMPLVAAIREQNPNASHKQIMDAAYDRAMWGNPEIRQFEMERMAKEKEQQRIQEAKAKAEAARRAGSSINGSPAGSTSSVGTMDLRAQLEQAFNDY